MKLQAVVLLLLASMIVISNSFLFPEFGDNMTKLLMRGLQKDKETKKQVSTLTLAVTICAKPRNGSTELRFNFPSDHELTRS